MRVLRLCSVFEAPLGDQTVRFDPVGGMQNHTAELTRRLDGLGVTQVVITTRPPGAPAEHVVGRRARVVRVGLPVPTFRQMWAVPALREAWRLAGSVDLVHAHLAEDIAIVPLALAAARRGLPLVVTVHTSLSHTLRVTDARAVALKALGAPLERWGEHRADAVVALTPRSARLLEGGGVRPDRLHVIPSGVDVGLFDGPHDDPFPHLSRPRVAFVGRLAPQKGVIGLVRAAARLRAPNVQIVLVGDGPDRQRLEREIHALGLADRVQVTGFVAHDRIPAVLAHVDVLVMPSVYEELGSALVEAMHAGVPIVATRVGGIPDVIEHGETGILVPPGDPGALASAIDDLLDDPRRAASLARRARTAAKRYDWDVLAKSVHDIYRTLTRPSVPRSDHGVGSAGSRAGGSPLELVPQVETALAGAATDALPFGDVDVSADRPGKQQHRP